MAEIGYFFTSAAGDRKYTSADFADLFYQLSQRQSGVIRGLDNTLALSNNGTLSIDVATGVAAKSGYLYQNTAAMNIALDAVTSGSKRIDRVVIRVDLTARQVVATVLKGVESGTPSAPAITGSTDILLGKILLDRSSGSYAYTVTDERTYSDAYLVPATIKKFNENTFSLDDLVDGVSFKRVTADAIGTGNKIDFSKTGFLNKTLDNIDDGDTYKRIAAAVATALNAGTYDAYSATSFGIGSVVKTLGTGTSLNQNFGSGFYFVRAPTPVPAGEVADSYYFLRVMDFVVAGSHWTYQELIGFDYASAGTHSYCWERWQRADVWDAAWTIRWSSYTDGNGGQPPAPKPKDTASSETGAFYSFSAGDNTAIVLPAGGQWVIVAAYYNRISDSVLLNGLTIGSNQSLVRAGGSTILGAVSGYNGVVHAWRKE